MEVNKMLPSRSYGLLTLSFSGGFEYGSTSQYAFGVLSWRTSLTQKL